MKNEDVELIQRILAGDENVFASLVRKYQRQLHTFAWRKICDFQIAEDIVQETFLQVYQKLHTLEDPTQFRGWLYQIANRFCIAWLRKNRVQTEPLAEVNVSEIETEAYSRYVATEHARATAEAQHFLVKKLLTKLKEKDRTVITLHYFEEMTSAEIGDFLGVSENTVKSRIRRAREQLKRYQFMIREALDVTTRGGYLSENEIKKEIIVSDKVKNESKVETSLKEIRQQIADIQGQVERLAIESDAFLSSEKKEAMAVLCRLPHGEENPLTWGYGGAYRSAPGTMSKRISFWSNSIDDFVSSVPTTAIVNLASLFTSHTLVSVLRELVEGSKSVKDLAEKCGISESEIEKAVQTLIDAKLAAHTEENLIEPKNDAVFYFLNFVGMTRVHLDPKNH